MPTVLIVDDKEENTYLLRTLLEAKGFGVVTASNGKEALESADRSLPDLVIADILMPVMDGFGLCRRWRAEERFRQIPFIFYTATYTDPQDEEFALSLGADRFVVKPQDPEVLLELIAGTMEEKRRGRLRAAAPAEEGDYLQAYNKTLVRKLEDKVTQLEQVNKALAVKDFAIASAISGIVLADLKGTISYANASFAAMCGYESRELVGRNLAELVSFGAEGDWVGERTAVRKDGTTFTIQMEAHRVLDAGGATLCLMASCIDVTEQVRMREELQRAQRMESLSLFAAGVAHDFNNLLTGLYSGLEIMEDSLPPGSQARAQYDIAFSVFHRARDLTQRLLAFAKGGAPAKKKLGPAEIVRESCALSLSGSYIRHTLAVDPGAWLIEADPGQLSQVFNNILVNARQAMGDKGSIDISVGNRALPTGRVADLQAGDYVLIEFRDDGPGISEDVLPRIFDPFFTTKEEGSGLGLATSYAIVKDHGGHLAATSRPGAGAAFGVWLPALREGEAERGREPTPERLPGSGRILLMDDEESIRKLTKQLLVRAGYEAVAAAGGREALQLFRSAGSAHRPFDLVILDLTIRGGMGGEETLAELRAIDPHVAAVASTGYSDGSVQARLRQCGFVGLLPKPYLAHELLSTVKAAIAAERA